jgi:cytochrome P450
MVDVVELPPIEYNPWLPEIHADPYPMYRRLREEDPVHSSLPGVYIVSRHQDVSWLLRDPKFSHDNRKSALYPMFIESLAPEERSFVEERMGQNMLFTDPPDHTRLRGLVSKAFGTRVIEALRPRVEQIVTELLDELIGAGPVDLVERFAYPVPVTVICELMGVPQEDRHLFHRWSADLVLTLDPLITPAVSEPELPEVPLSALP